MSLSLSKKYWQKQTRKNLGINLPESRHKAQKRGVAAKVVLSDITLEELRYNPVVPYEDDEVTRIIESQVNEKIYSGIKNWSVSEFREWILDSCTTGEDIKRVSRGLTSEMVAAVTKLMGNLDLIFGASKINIRATCNTEIGLPGTLSVRLQPNHPTDDPQGVAASLMEGLSYGIGDAVIGLNPVNDSVESVTKILKRFEEFKQTWQIPTQNCVLAHVTTQMEAIKKGAPADLIFQSIAGSQKSNDDFGINGAMIEEAMQLALKEGTATGPNVMYFETGQGAELSSEGHFGADQLTMEARCYGFAKKYKPFIVNTVVGLLDLNIYMTVNRLSELGSKIILWVN